MIKKIVKKPRYIGDCQLYLYSHVRMERQTSMCQGSGGSHFTEKASGIEYSYV